MKKSFKAITSLVLMVLVLMSLSVSAFAAAPSPTASITFRGEKQGFGFQSGDMNYTATDLFDSFKNVMPGDNLTESISFTYAPQDAADCDFVNLYMKAVPHDETATPSPTARPLRTPTARIRPMSTVSAMRPSRRCPTSSLSSP